MQRLQLVSFFATLVTVVDMQQCLQQTGPSICSKTVLHCTDIAIYCTCRDCTVTAALMPCCLTVALHLVECVDARCGDTHSPLICTVLPEIILLWLLPRTPMTAGGWQGTEDRQAAAWRSDLKQPCSCGPKAPQSWASSCLTQQGICHHSDITWVSFLWMTLSASPSYSVVLHC